MGSTPPGLLGQNAPPFRANANPWTTSRASLWGISDSWGFHPLAAQSTLMGEHERKAFLPLKFDVFRGGIRMFKYRHFELLSRGPVSRVRLLDHRPFCQEKVAELTSEWNSVADRADCRALVVDCSNVKLLSSEMLSKLILLQRRLTRKNARLVLAGLRRSPGSAELDQARPVLRDQEGRGAGSGRLRVGRGKC